MPIFHLKPIRSGRRRSASVVAMACAALVIVSGLVALTPPPTAQAQAIISGGPFAVTNVGGNLAATIDLAGANPSDEQHFVSTGWPEAVGLQPNPSLSDLFQATYQHYEATYAGFSVDGATQDQQPPVFQNGSITVASDGSGGSTASVTVPAADVSSFPGGLKGFLATLAGALSALLVTAGCSAAILALAVAGGPLVLVTGGLSPLAFSLCSGLAAASWTLVSNLVSQAITGDPWTADVWKDIVTGVVTAVVFGGVGGLALTKFVPVVGSLLLKVASYLGSGAIRLVSFTAKWLGSGYNRFLAAAKRFFLRGQTEIETELPNIEAGAGLSPPSSSGSFHTAPSSPANPGTPVGANCIDAYGSDGESDPGHPIAINECNDNPAQDFDFYPTGQVAVFGLCVSAAGPASAVTLQACDGSAGQAWAQTGSTLVNKASSSCLTDPNGVTTPGTQLTVAACSGSASQQWLSPAAETCDIYAAYGTACVATYSMTRALYASYSGPLYRVERASDAKSSDVGLLNTGGDVNAATQDAFCANTTCTVTTIYDQSPRGNTLTVEGAGGNGGDDHGANATALPIKIGGHEAYGLDIEPSTGYRVDTTDGVATDGEAEGMYMVASGTHVNKGCCFDFGNAEANNNDTGDAHMDAVNLTTYCGSNSAPCSGEGPWVQADLENGQWMGSGPNPANIGNATPFVTAMLKNNGRTTFSLKGGNSQSGALSTWWDGSLPSAYQPMHQEGAVVLGTGGDNSQSGVGSWFEGVMTAGYPSDTADAAVQANIVAAAYTGSTNPSGSGGGPCGGPTGSDGVATAGQALVHGGYTSTYTVDAANNHLQENYLSGIGANWISQDLTAKYGTPAVAAGTEPVAIVHPGPTGTAPYTSVYTADAATGHLDETYLSAVGQPWVTQDLTAKYGTPTTGVTPTAVVHAGYTSVYTVDESNGHLDETYLTSFGQPWTVQDLTAKYGSPLVEAGTSPVAIVHQNYTSVYTVNSARDLYETYLPVIGQPWNVQDLTTKYGTPKTVTTPTAVVHAGYTSVYTVDDGSRHLQETYLSGIGAPWLTQDFTAKYGTPPVAPGTQPSAMVHTGYTSVYTIDQASDHLHETYLDKICDPWVNQDLSAKYGTNPTTRSPIALVHPDTSGNLTWSSVYTIDQATNHLRETYFAKIGDPWTTQDLTAKYGTPAAYATDPPASNWSLSHDGYTSTYTVDASNNHLQETYLSGIGANWITQDLTAKFGVPLVQSGIAPVAITHNGYVSVYTVDAGSHDLQETYLSGIGASWITQDLTAKYDAPTTTVRPAAVYHENYTSVFTVAAGSNDLDETYLSKIGNAWVTHDLTTGYGAHTVLAGTSPSAVVHSGWTSVYTTDPTDDLQETYLSAIGTAWAHQDLTTGYGVARTSTTPSAVEHDGYTSVFTVDNSSDDLRETYLPAIGDPWTSQDLTAAYRTPAAQPGLAPSVTYHTGYLSVYTLDRSTHDIDETYLPAIGDPWTTQDLSTKYNVPSADQAPSPLLHSDTAGGLTWISVFTVDNGSYDLRETYLASIGQPWTTQDLTTKYGTPPV